MSVNRKEFLKTAGLATLALTSGVTQIGRAHV